MTNALKLQGISGGERLIENQSIRTALAFARCLSDRTATPPGGVSPQKFSPLSERPSYLLACRRSEK